MLMFIIIIDDLLTSSLQTLIFLTCCSQKFYDTLFLCNRYFYTRLYKQ